MVIHCKSIPSHANSTETEVGTNLENPGNRKQGGIYDNLEAKARDREQRTLQAEVDAGVYFLSLWASNEMVMGKHNYAGFFHMLPHLLSGCQVPGTYS